MATPKICSIDGCGKAHAAKGLCKNHYYRMRDHGDPTAGRTPPGAAEKFYRDVVLNFNEDECLTWPFTRSGGYATMKRKGKNISVPRMVCEDENGPPPEDHYHAAHSCGKGHEGCVSRRHLSWKTPSDNMKDKDGHGTHCKGERHNMVKLSESQITEIRELNGKLSQRAIAEKYGVGQQQVSRIMRRERWQHIP